MDNRHKSLIHVAVGLGAVKAKIIETGSISTAAWVRLKCQFGCPHYNTTLCCPPATPAPALTREILDCYRNAILVHCDESTSVTVLAARLERNAFLSGYYKAFSLGAGPCTLCKECSKSTCKNPFKARPSMEACGIDVFATARNNGYPIEVLREKPCDANYYGLVLLE